MMQGNDFNEKDSTLFGAPTDEAPAKRKKRTALKSQQLAIIVSGVIALAAITLYLLVVAPSIKRANEKKDEPPTLLAGEVLGTNNSIVLYTPVEKEGISKIEVSNEKGGYGFYYNGIYKDFYVADNPSAPYDKTQFAYLTAAVGQAYVSERLLDECDDMSEYGLDESQNPTSYTLTTKKGEVHTVYIGNRTASGSGYYARHADRNAVYILGNNIGKTVFCSLEEMISPILALPMQQNDYFMIKKFTLMRGSNVALQVTYLDEAEQKAAAATTAYKMLAPGDYAVNSTNYLTALESIMNFTGSSTLVYAPTEEQLEAYGISEKAFSIHYTYQGIDQSIVFSKKNEDGNYYAYSLLFDLIAEVDGKKLEWLEWDTLKWVDYPIFMMNINDIKTFGFEIGEDKFTFDVYGVDTGLTVTERNTGFKPDVTNFRKLYRVLLMTHMQNYVSEDLDAEAVETLVAENEPYLVLTVETRAGQVTEFKFYPYNSRRVYYTVNGEGEFYVLRDQTNKLISDAKKVMSGEAVDPDAPN